MGLSFLSLLYLQVSYIEEMVKMRKEQFEENVGRSLAQAVHNLELVETKNILKKMLRPLNVLHSFLNNFKVNISLSLVEVY